MTKNDLTLGQAMRALNRAAAAMERDGSKRVRLTVSEDGNRLEEALVEVIGGGGGAGDLAGGMTDDPGPIDLRRGRMWMKRTPYKGWAVFAIGARAEWPCHWTISDTRKGASERWASERWKDEIYNRADAEDEIYNRADAEEIFRRRIADGSLRVGRVMVQAQEDGE